MPLAACSTQLRALPLVCPSSGCPDRLAYSTVPVADVKQGYESIALYKDVLVNMPTLNTDTMGPREELKAQKMEMNENDAETLPPWRLIYPKTIHAYRRTSSRRTSTAFGDIDKTRQWFGKASSSWEWRVERDIDQWMALVKNREELDEVYDGIHVIVTSIFGFLFSTLICLMFVFVVISCLHRITSILSSLGICLLLTSAYMKSTFAIVASFNRLHYRLPIVLIYPLEWYTHH